MPDQGWVWYTWKAHTDKHENVHVRTKKRDICLVTGSLIDQGVAGYMYCHSPSRAFCLIFLCSLQYAAFEDNDHFYLVQEYCSGVRSTVLPNAACTDAKLSLWLNCFSSPIPVFAFWFCRIFCIFKFVSPVWTEQFQFLLQQITKNGVNKRWRWTRFQRTEIQAHTLV